MGGVGGWENTSPFKQPSGAAQEAAEPRELAGWMKGQAWSMEVSDGLEGRSWAGIRGGLPEPGELVRECAPVVFQRANATVHPAPRGKSLRRKEMDMRACPSATGPPPTSPLALSPLPTLLHPATPLRPQAGTTYSCHRKEKRCKVVQQPQPEADPAAQVGLNLHAAPPPTTDLRDKVLGGEMCEVRGAVVFHANTVPRTQAT